MKKWEPLQLTLDNWKCEEGQGDHEDETQNVQNNESLSFMKCKFLQVLLRRDQWDLISGMSSTKVCMELDFLCSPIQVIKMSSTVSLKSVNTVYEFPKFSPQLQVKSFKITWRIDFFLFLINYGKNRYI